MLYDIGLTIAYDYDRPAVAGRHILRLMPADLPGEQRRITGLLGISPEPAERRRGGGTHQARDVVGQRGDQVLRDAGVGARAERDRGPRACAWITPLAEHPDHGRVIGLLGRHHRRARGDQREREEDTPHCDGA